MTRHASLKGYCYDRPRYLYLCCHLRLADRGGGTHIDGPDVNTTSFRMIAIQSLPNKFWGKLDAKVPVEWVNDNEIPATFEVQLGKMFSSSFGTYVDGLVGIGGHRPYDWGVGVGVRFLY